MKKLFIISTLLFVSPLFGAAQNITQTIRGKIVDIESKYPLIGAHVVLISDTTKFVGTTADLDGYFRIEEVSLGRHTLKISYLGYRESIIPNIIVNSGKEVVLNIEMEESVVKIGTVEITATRRGEVINEMSTVSARAFSIEETERYAGSRGDPARMASNFAGVQGNNDSSNDIVIRGNSPLGTLWRFEGVNIPNPNHFGVSGTTGGPVGILNNKVLSNSDFMTGAFPAEYGNSIAGVFDLKMKNGNNENHEFSGQWGFLGTEIFAEGPISKKNKSSYLISYRYSSLQIFHALGINIGTDAVPKYQDMSFKLNFPTKKSGSISIFGIGGISNIDIMKSDQLDTGKTQLYGDVDLDEQFKTGMGIIGLNYFKSFNSKTYLRVTLSSSLERQENIQHKFEYKRDSTDEFVILDGKYIIDTTFQKLGFNIDQAKHSASFFVNKKLNNRHTIKVGIITDLYQQVNMIDSIYNETDSIWVNRMDHKGFMSLLQPYLQWKYKITDELTLNTGIHGQFLTSNGSTSIEPRAGLKWRFTPAQALSLGIGMHSQMLPTYIYFAGQQNEDGSYDQFNKDLGFLRSTHYVLAYDNSLNNSLRIRIETYYQQLSNIPVEVKSSSYSVLNAGAELNRFFPNRLTNKGTGENYGIEFTLEKFFSKTYFFMLSASLYESKYKASDGKTYNTTFNGNYVVNLLGTKEFQWGKKSNTTFGIGGKVSIAGNKRYTPFDLAASDSAGFGISDYSQWNTKQLNQYFRADIKLNYKINTRKLTHEIGLDLVNIFGTENVFKRTYTGGSSPVREDLQLGFLPIFYYKVDF